MPTFLKLMTAFLLLLLVPVSDPLFSVPRDNRPFITAHRGSSAVAPENTMAAVFQAIQDGAHMVEIDVQMTQDGIVVLFHDETLQKLGLPGRVPDTPYRIIASADAGSWHSPAFAGEPVPVLEQVLLETKGKIRLNIELKMTDPSLPLPEAVAELLDAHGMADSAIVTSFDREAVRRVKAANPEVRTGLIIGRKKAFREDVWEEDVDVLSLKSKWITRKMVDQATQAGKEVHAWTVNSKTEMTRMMRLGVASVITDHPEALSALLH